MRVRSLAAKVLPLLKLLPLLKRWASGILGLRTRWMKKAAIILIVTVAVVLPIAGCASAQHDSDYEKRQVCQNRCVGGEPKQVCY